MNNALHSPVKDFDSLGGVGIELYEKLHRRFDSLEDQTVYLFGNW